MAGGLSKREKVYSYLRSYMDQNKFTHKEARLPSEQFLSHRLGVSRETVRAAIFRLTEEGFVYAVKGSGTFFDKAKALSSLYTDDHAKYRIALIIQGQDKHANSALVRGIKSSLEGTLIELKLFLTDNRLTSERKCLLACLSGFHGLIVDGVKASLMNPNMEYYLRFYENNIPCIFYNNYYEGTQFPKIIIDDPKCADRLIQILTSKGHTKIAGIFVYDNHQGIEKYKGYVKAIRTYGAEFDDAYIKWCISSDINDSAFPKALIKFLKGIPKCTAIVCCNIMILKVVREVLGKLGKAVPQDYSLVCFDYSDSDYEQLGITSSLHPGFAMGEMLAKNIVAMIEDPNFKHHDYSYIFPPLIHEGFSVKEISPKLSLLSDK